MIVVRYWLAEGMPRVETIEWQPASWPQPGVTITIPDVAEVIDMTDPSASVEWISVCQPSFAEPAEQGVDLYTLAPAEGAQVVTKAEWDAANEALEQAREDNEAKFRAQVEDRLDKRQEAIEKIAESAGLTTEQTEALIGTL